jgi:Mce-associated membrane protein
VGLVALLAVAAVGAATLAAVFAGRLQGERRDRGEVKRVAAAMVTALTTYDYARLDDSRRQVLELATGRFRDEYDRGAAPLRQVLAQTQARSTGRVTKVYLGQIADGGAEALVSADQVVTGVGGSRPVTGELLSLTLVHAGGRWRVDGLALEAGGSGGGGAAPGTPPPAPGTTSTTAP